ncbi:MAG: ribonuclease HIII [Bacilli bacterium]|nr:ribonuclease HIII [Bacilli bacterium]
MVVVFKISDNTREKMNEYYQDKKRDKVPPYAVFQAEEGGTIITLYESGKVMFQGISADVDANMWRDMEAHLNNGKPPEESKKKEKDKKSDEELYEERKKYYYINSVGSDEVGTGDYFGPIVVTSSFVAKEDIPFLEELGVRDSKKLTDAKILEVVPRIIKRIPYETVIYTNEEYNKHPEYNMNKVKAILHNKVLLGLMKKNNFNYDKVVIDQFCYPRNYFAYLKEANNVFRNVTFTTKAEDKCLSVACGSLISRYIFIKEMDKISKKLGKQIPKGAGVQVDVFGKWVVSKYGTDYLKSIAKLNFKNTDKILKD